jgi:hypothetical protein
MSDVPTVRSGAPDFPHAAISQPACSHESLAEPLEVIRLSLASVDAARERFPGYRLTRLVGARLDLDEIDIGRLSDVLGIDMLRPITGPLRPFDFQLRQMIERYDLGAFFSDDGHAPYHMRSGRRVMIFIMTK